MSKGDAAPPADVSVSEDLTIPVGDDTVSAIRYRPQNVEGPLPAVLMYTPYHNDDIITFGGYDPLLRYVAAYGYEVVAADMVGTGTSSGTIEEMFPHREAEEAMAIIEWLADRPWTTGRVGMMGKSYGGITALWAAAERPDALDAIVPILTPYTGFRNGYFGDGLFEFFGIGGDWLPLMQVLDAKPPGRRDDDGRWANVWNERLRTLEKRDPWLIQFRDHPSKDEYWADKDIDVDAIETPTLAVGGWRDGYTTETVEFFDAISGPKRLLFGPWRHTMPHRGHEVAVDFRRQTVEWFDHFLKDEDNGATEHPTVTYWTERDGGGEPGAGLWRGRDTWPTLKDGSESETLAVTPHERQAGTPGALAPLDSFAGGDVTVDYETDQTVGMDSMEGMVAAADGQPLDTHADDVRSLRFDTDPLADPVELTGSGEVTLQLESTSRDPIVAVRVIDVSPEGVGRLVTRGFVRPGFEDGVADGTPFEPGEEREVHVPLQPKSHVFEAGHRIRLAISGAYFPLVMPARSGGTFTVRSAPDTPTTLEFPGRYLDDTSFDDEVVLNGPDESVPVASEFFTKNDASWEVTRDRVGGTGTVRSSTEYSFEPQSGDPERATMAESITFAQDIEATVHSDDPGTAVLFSDTRVEMVYEVDHIVVEGSTRLARDTVQMTTTVTVDDRTVFEKTWSR